MAGAIGGELSPIARGSEEAFIGSMFQNLGRLLAQFYFPEEANNIRTLTQSARDPKTEAAAAVSDCLDGGVPIGYGPVDLQ